MRTEREKKEARLENLYKIRSQKAGCLPCGRAINGKIRKIERELALMDEAEKVISSMQTSNN